MGFNKYTFSWRKWGQKKYPMARRDLGPTQNLGWGFPGSCLARPRPGGLRPIHRERSGSKSYMFLFCLLFSLLLVVVTIVLLLLSSLVFVNIIIITMFSLLCIPFLTYPTNRPNGLGPSKYSGSRGNSVALSPVPCLALQEVELGIILELLKGLSSAKGDRGGMKGFHMVSYQQNETLILYDDHPFNQIPQINVFK